MCYDISYQITLDTLEEYFGNIVFDDPQIELDFEITAHVLAQAYKKGLIVVNDGTQYRGKMFEWGVIANYMDTRQDQKDTLEHVQHSQ